MNFIDRLTGASSDWSVGDIVVAGTGGLYNYLIIKSSGVGSVGTLYYLINIATMEAYLSASTLNTAPDSLKQKFITANPSLSIDKVIPQALLSIVADETP